MTQRALVFAAAVGLVACIPGRDNPNDPKVAPAAKLSVSPSEGTQHTVFTLSAAGSTGHGTLQYCWDLDGDPSTFEKPCGAAVLTTALLPIPAGALGGGGEGTFTLNVHVKVESDTGSTLAAFPVLLHNTRPVADAGAEIITAFGTSSTVELDGCAGTTPSACASFDPDGDDVAWDWKQVGGPTPVTITYPTADHRRAQFVAPATPQVLYFELTGTDGSALARSRTIVRVGTPAWLTATSPTRLLRIHSEGTSFPMPDGPDFDVGIAEAFSTDESGDVWMQRSALHDVVRVTPSGSVMDRFSLPSQALPLLARTGGACALVFDSLSSQEELGILRPVVGSSNGTFTPISPTGVIDPTGLIADADPTTCIVFGVSGAARVRVDDLTQAPLDLGTFPISADSVMTADGALWSVVPFNGQPHVLRRASDGTTTEYISDVSGLSSAFLALPVDGESVVVLFRTADDTATIGFFGSPREFRQIAVPQLSLDIETIWAALPEAGAIFALGIDDGLIQRFSLRGNALVLDATADDTEIEAPNSFVDSISPDPWIGGVLARERPEIQTTTSVSSMLRVPASLHPMETVSPAGFAFTNTVEPSNGSVWTGVAGQITMRLDGAGRAAAAIPTPTNHGLAGYSYALPDGGVRVIRSDTREIQRFDRHGALTESIPIVSPLDIYDVGQDATGAARCASGPDGSGKLAIARISGQTMTTLATGLASSGSVGTPSGKCWFTTGANELRFDDGASVSTLATAFSPLGSSMRADPRDDSLWVEEDSVSTIHHLSTTGTNLGSFSLPAGPFTLSKRCSSTSDVTCLEIWLATTTNVIRYRADGVEVARYALPVGLAPNDLSVAP